LRRCSAHRDGVIPRMTIPQWTTSRDQKGPNGTTVSGIRLRRSRNEQRTLHPRNCYESTTKSPPLDKSTLDCNSHSPQGQKLGRTMYLTTFASFEMQEFVRKRSPKSLHRPGTASQPLSSRRIRPLPSLRRFVSRASSFRPAICLRRSMVKPAEGLPIDEVRGSRFPRRRSFCPSRPASRPSLLVHALAPRGS
jgi:hypothetical protein